MSQYKKETIGFCDRCNKQLTERELINIDGIAYRFCKRCYNTFQERFNKFMSKG